ncbi:MAG: hypothetical protein KDC92_06345 [Bacteroidetes bacterium]|nr:hypothetical protein [Bacteroidota bacterium]
MVNFLAAAALPDTIFKVKNIRQVYSDQLSHFYVVTKKNVVEKYHVQKGFQKQFSLKRLGELHSIDVSSPNKVYCFFKDVGKIVILDNQLSEVGQIDLFAAGYFNIESVCRARDNAIWIFDKADARLKKIDHDGNEVFISTQLNLGNTNLYPLRMYETAKQLVLVDSNNLVVLNNQLITSFKEKITSISKLSFFASNIIYRDTAQWVELSLTTLEKKQVLLPASKSGQEIRNVLFAGNFMLVLIEDSIQVFTKD